MGWDEGRRTGRRIELVLFSFPPSTWEEGDPRAVAPGPQAQAQSSGCWTTAPALIARLLLEPFASSADALHCPLACPIGGIAALSASQASWSDLSAVRVEQSSSGDGSCSTRQHVCSMIDSMRRHSPLYAWILSLRLLAACLLLPDYCLFAGPLTELHAAP
jgi:hypothetical protein